MSDYENRDDGKAGAFLVGFFVGVLVCLTGGGVFFMIQQQRLQAVSREAILRAEEARMQAMVAQQQAEKLREKAKDSEKRKVKDENKEKE